MKQDTEEQREVAENQDPMDNMEQTACRDHVEPAVTMVVREHLVTQASQDHQEVAAIGVRVETKAVQEILDLKEQRDVRVLLVTEDPQAPQGLRVLPENRA